MGNINDILPTELVDIILSFLKNTDRMMLRQVCHDYLGLERHPINLVDIVRDGSLNILQDFYILISDSEFLSSGRICEYASLGYFKMALNNGCWCICLRVCSHMWTSRGVEVGSRS